MPKEAVYSREDQQAKIEIGWARDRYVQVATLRQQQQPVLLVGAPTLGSGVITYNAAATSGHEPMPKPFNAADHEPSWVGHAVDLDRAGINHLIRTLRRARDQAFGRDE